MNKKKWWLVFGLVLVVFLVYKFKQERGLDRKLVESKVNEIIAFEHSEADKRCKQASLRAAATIVDSLLQIWGEQSSFDTTGRPAIPSKPGDPGFSSPLDNVPLKPLFDSTLKK